MTIGFEELSRVCWVDDIGSTHTDFCLNGHFLEDGEVLIVRSGAELERIVLKKRTIITNETEFGGAYHGFTHKHYRNIYSYGRDDEIFFIEFLDNTQFARVNKPLGEKVPKSLQNIV